MPDTVLEAMDRFGGSLDDLGKRAQRTLLAEYRAGWNVISRDLEALTAKIATAPKIPIITADGSIIQGVPPSWTFQQSRYIALQEDVAALMQRTEQALAGVTRAGQPEAWSLGGNEATATGRSLAEIPLRSWASAPQGAFQAFVGGAKSGPLAGLLATFALTNGPQAAGYARDVIGAGLLRGRSPLRVADDLASGLQTLSYSRALRIARTETLRAYREGARQSYLANPQIVASWAWRAAVENTKRPPCAACFAQHGSLHPIDEPMSTHPNCRCRMVPRRSPVLGVDPKNPVLPDATAAFNALPPATQRRIMGPTRLQLLQSGKVKLPDLATSRARGAWGVNNATVRPLSELRNLSAQARALPQAADRLFAQSARAEAGVSADLQRIGQQTGAQLDGFGYRLKRPDRIAEKIQTDVLDGKGGILHAGEHINDALRYTYRLEPAKYAAQVVEINRSLLAQGYTFVKPPKNFWNGPPGYRGYHTLWRTPEGARFELQFHTRQTLAIKAKSHPLYNIQRLDSTSAAEKLRLQGEIDELWSRARFPKGAQGIPDTIDGFGLTSKEWYAKIARIEDDLVQNRDFETAVVFDTRVPGKILLDKRGAALDVEFTTAEEALMRGNLLTHNHPRAWAQPYPDGTFAGGSSFSEPDVFFMLRREIVEMRAVSIGWRHSVRPGPSWTGSPEDFVRLQEEIYVAARRAREILNEGIAVARREANALIASTMGEAGRLLSPAEAYARLARANELIQRATTFAEFEHQHIVWGLVERATDFLRYTRDPR